MVEVGEFRELTCGFCGITLDRGVSGEQFTGEAQSTNFSKTIQESKRNLATNQQLRPLIHICEDSRLIRRIVTQHLQKRFPAAEVVISEDGRQGVENLTRVLLPGERRGIAIFDLQMPKLNGISAATALRAVEVALGRKPLPVIFFSAVRVNDKLKEAMSEAMPASYLHKSDTENPENMLGRLEEVMAVMIKRVYG